MTLVSRYMAISIAVLCGLTGQSQSDVSIAQQLYADELYEAVIQHVRAFEIRYADDLLIEANAHHKLKAYSEAVSAYTQVLDLDDGITKAYMHRGAAYLELGEFVPALRDVEKALKMNPEDAEVNFHMGNICYDQDDMRNAVKYYKRAINLRPGYPQATYMLGASRSMQGDPKEAAKAFSSILGDLPEAKYNLAVVKLEAGDNLGAIELFNELEQSDWDKSVDLYFFRAEAYFFIGDKHSACLDYHKAADMGDEEAISIYDGYCMKNRKKPKRKERQIISIEL